MVNRIVELVTDPTTGLTSVLVDSVEVAKVSPLSAQTAIDVALGILARVSGVDSTAPRGKTIVVNN